MAFFVLDRDSGGGSLRLPIDGVFETREEALAALSAAVSAGTASVKGQVYVADLDAAVPVLVMPTLPPAEPVVEAEGEAPVAEELAVDLDEAALVAEEADVPDEDVVGDDDVDVEVDVGEEGPSTEALEEVPLLGAAIAGGSLADAIKRAATSLEDEGITAPESISAEDFSFEEEIAPAPSDDAESTDTQDADAASIGGVGVAEPMSALESEDTEVLEAPAEWPWANVEAFTGGPEEDEAQVEAEPEIPSAEAEPVTSEPDDADTLITSAPPLGEEAYVPRPVILGDYADLADDTAVAAEVEEPAGEMGELPAEEQSDGSPFDSVAATTEITEPDQDAKPEMAYESTGELDLSEYTCNDCVYSNTCPKVGEVTPADCGTFQWRSS